MLCGTRTPLGRGPLKPCGPLWPRADDVSEPRDGIHLDNSVWWRSGRHEPSGELQHHRPLLPAASCAATTLAIATAAASLAATAAVPADPSCTSWFRIGALPAFASFFPAFPWRALDAFLPPPLPLVRW